MHHQSDYRRQPRTSLGVALIVLLTCLAAGAMASGGTASAMTTTDPVVRLYDASTADLANPERGMYHYTESHMLPDGSGFQPLDVAQMRTWRTLENVTVVYRIFYLEKYAAIDRMTAQDLARISGDFAAARAAGVKLVVRFAYTSSSGADAPAERAVAQIEQLAPVLNAAVDVILALQAGFVGRWGEWYYSDSYASDPATPWLLTEADWAARGRVLHTLLDATAHEMPVQVRYPGVKQRLVPPEDPRAGRVGVHNDCFLAGTDDYGTFVRPTDRAWLAAQTESVLMGGESCAMNAPRSQWPSASSELAAYHWSYLNSDFEEGVLASWGAEGRGEARRRLGYRLRLVQSTLPSTSRPGAVLPGQLHMINDGYAAPFAARPLQLVMQSATVTYRVPLPVDVRTFRPGLTSVVALNVPAPSLPGSYALFLAMPDAAAALADDPAYAVQLANTSLWDAAHGWNDLRQTLVVTDSAAPAEPVGGGRPVLLSSLTPTASMNGWGPSERDLSNGEAATGDGRMQRIGGQSFCTGLGVHSASSVAFSLAGAYGRFRARVGIDDETGGRGSAVFRVYVDDVLVFTSPLLRGNQPAVPVDVSVAGADRLRLVVTDGGDGTAHDHADWGGAVLLPRASTTPTPVSPPTPPSTLLSSLTPTRWSNGSGPYEVDGSNGSRAAGDGSTIRLRGQAFLAGLGVHAPSSLTYDVSPMGPGTLRATIGVDDETGGRGSAVFQVWVDGVMRYTSPVLTGTSAPLLVVLAVPGARSLRLVVNAAGDGTSSDHADWAGVRLCR